MCLASEPTAVLLDLDGVLVDSRTAISRSISHALAEHDFPQPSLASLERFIGPQLTLAFAELTAQPPDSPAVLACLTSYRARYRDASLRETTVFDGIPAVLGVLGEQHLLAVATSKPLAFAEPLLRALDLRGALDHVAAPDLDAHNEDKAATIRSALHALGTQRAVMVGDRSFDVIGAHACDIPAIGVSWGIGTRDELADANADRIVDQPGKLPAVISDLLA